MLLSYDSSLKPFSQALRRSQTDAYNLLWFRPRRKQLKKTPYYRQKPIGPYIFFFEQESIHGPETA